jgi:HAD superfamily hydrolase (TIGR01509 family)
LLRAILLDLDGTLAETDSLHHPAWADTLRPYGYEVDLDFYQRRISGRLNPDIVGDLLPDLSHEQATGMIEAKEAAFRERAAGLEPLPGLMEFIEASRKSGIWLSLVTNAPRQNVRAVLQTLGLAEIFDGVVLSEEVASGKPDPAPYSAALEQLSVSPEEALAFEDSPSGIRSAVAAGVPTVGVSSTHDPEGLREVGAEITVPDFTDPRLEILLQGS